MANQIYANYFGTKSQFDPNDRNLGDNSYQVNGITTGFNGRNSIGVQRHWIAKKNLARTNKGLQALNSTFGQSFKDVKSAQNYINQMLKLSSQRVGADFGSIAVDGKWGDQTQQALDLINKVYSDSGNNWNSQVSNQELTDSARLESIPTQPLNPVVESVPVLNKVNRTVVRQGLAKVSGADYVGIRNTDQLRQALMDPNATEFIRDLALTLKNRKYGITDDAQWNRALQDMHISGNIGAKDRKDLRHWYNMNPYIIKNQHGGKMSDEEQIKQAFAEFCKANNLQPNEDSWKQFQEYLQQLAEQQTQVARLGAKLNYINQIKGKCPEGTQRYYFKAGGRICSACRGIKMGEEGMEMANNKPKKKAISPVVSNIRNQQNSTYTKQDDKRFSQLASKKGAGTLTPQEAKEYQQLMDKFKRQPKKVQQQFEVEEGKQGAKITKHQSGGSFKEAYNTARNKRVRYFTWNGKSYNTRAAGNDSEYGSFKNNISDLNTSAPAIITAKRPANLLSEVVVTAPRYQQVRHIPAVTVVAQAPKVAAPAISYEGPSIDEAPKIALTGPEVKTLNAPKVALTGPEMVQLTAPKVALTGPVLTMNDLRDRFKNITL